ncbi:nSTAND1 domain-containing NTPase [Streptomyces jumonjinensis]|uniref:nSTAND1 domain-containing NTPase n=1 Tax=Streptomyces jumonjinensis TaxID=1945 RepID=UPI003798BA83
MGRPEKELDPAAGPVQRLAAELRVLRAEAGRPTYRAMAARAGFSAPTLSAAAAGERLPSLPVLRAYVFACGGDPRAWEPRWHRANRELSEQSAAADSDPSPYPGLARFSAADHAWFHGRAELTAQLAELTLAQPITAVVGASGSGKSSLLHAGLVPLLRTSPATTGGRLAAIRVLTPGRRPAHTHRERFTPAPGDGDTLLVVDQFEETYTLCHDQRERIAFLDLLRTACDPARRLRAVLAVRADFYGRCAEYGPFADALRNAFLLIGPMTAEQLREAVVRPAASQRLLVERALTARIVADTEGEPGGLPLMAHALREVWRRRSGRRLTEAAYDAIGGVQGAVAHTAETLYAELTETEAETARALLLRLVAPGDGAPDTRRRADRAELDASPLAARTLERLIAARLLTADGDEVELAHEALLTAWPRLRGWIEKDRERLRRHRRLTEAAQAWEELGRDPGALYRGVRLTLARETFAAAGLTDSERAFLEAGVDALRQEERAARRTTRRLRTLTGVLAVLLTLAMAAGIALWRQSALTAQQRDQAEARRIAAVAATLRTTDPRTALRLGVAAYRIADLPETRAALRAGAGQRDQDLFAPVADREPNGPSRLSADGTTLASVVKDRILRWDIATHRRIGDHHVPGVGAGLIDLAPDLRTVAYQDGDAVVLRRLPGGAAVRLPLGKYQETAGFSPDGRLFLNGQRTGLQVWDARDGRLRHSVRDADTSRAPEGAVSDDNRLVAWCTRDDRRLALRDLTGRSVQSPPRSLALAACAADEIVFTPDSRAVAVRTPDTIRVWDLRTGRERPRIPVRDAHRIVFAASGRWAATQTTDAVRVWRTDAPDRPVRTFERPGRSVADIRIDERAGVLRYQEGWGTVSVRTLSLAGALERRPAHHRLRDARFSPDGAFLATVDNGRVMLRNTRGGPVRRLPGRVCADCRPLLAFSPDSGALVYTTGPRAADGRVVATATGRTRWTARLPEYRESVRLGPGGRSLTLSRTIAVKRNNDHWRVEAWRIDPHGRERLLAADTAGITSFVTPERNAVLTADGRAHTPRTGRSRPATPGESMLDSAAFSSDGRLMAVGDATGRVTLWDRRTGERLAVLTHETPSEPGDRGGIVSHALLAFSPDGDLIAVGGADGTVRVWETAAPRLADTVLTTVDGPVLDLTITDGALRVATPRWLSPSYELDPASLARATCARAGELTRAQWAAFVPGPPYRPTC